MPQKRLSLVERQQKLLEEKGFSSAPATSSRQRGGLSSGFVARNDAMLARAGRANAAAGSRVAEPMFDADGGDDADDDDDGARSVASRASRAPSMHPSMAGTVVSRACSESTVGAGDATEYWDYQHRAATRADLGHRCRECGAPFAEIGEPLTERRGARVSMRYHAECFSGYADPRSQASSSAHVGRLAGTQFGAAPASTSRKMRTAAHFDGGGDRSTGLAKLSAFNGNGFGANSSRGEAQNPLPAAPSASGAHGGLTAAQLAAHDQALRAIPESAEDPARAPAFDDD